jgi:adenosylcobinamide kinase/adenosylcobinamide-phosphate guanylyltransferase
MIVFISGGARSGKSSYAEELAYTKHMILKNRFSEGKLYYIASSRRSDNEMEQRIAIHQERRSKQWTTIEEPYDIVPLLSEKQKGDVVLFDCLTVWLSNMIFDLDYSLNGLTKVVCDWLALSKKQGFDLIIVSNDVNEGLPMDGETVQKYMYYLGKLHQLAAAGADQTIQMTAGIPIYWKEGEK